MCETLINSCGLQENDTQVMKCNNLSSDVGTGDKVHLADNWNAGCGISTNFAGGSNKSIPDATTATGDLSKDQNVTSNVTATIPKAANTTEFELPGDQNSTTTLLGTKNATDVELPSRKIQRACRRRRPSPAGANKNTSESEIPSIKNSTALNTTTVPGTANATEPKTLGDKNEAAVNKTALPELTKNSTALEISGDQNKTAVNSTSLPEASKNTTGLGIQSNQSKTAQSTNFPSGLTNFTKLDVASTRNATNSKNISAEKGQNQEDQKNGKEKKIKPSEEVK
ncbi:hypothetical protein BY996DRAFT_4348837 [Phakopsora pachyrhizi]|nr:hypothetical protein BY996DRAFT_4348837 [Phakopsora pachyrhizi]